MQASTHGRGSPTAPRSPARSLHSSQILVRRTRSRRLRIWQDVWPSRSRSGLPSGRDWCRSSPTPARPGGGGRIMSARTGPGSAPAREAPRPILPGYQPGWGGRRPRKLANIRRSSVAPRLEAIRGRNGLRTAKLVPGHARWSAFGRSIHLPGARDPAEHYWGEYLTHSPGQVGPGPSLGTRGRRSGTGPDRAMVTWLQWGTRARQEGHQAGLWYHPPVKQMNNQRIRVRRTECRSRGR